MSHNYLDLLAYFGIGGAHPGGFPLTQRLLQDEIITPCSSVLDIGCGTGQTAAFLNQKYGCHVTAVDNHPIMLEKARERFKNQESTVQVIEGDAQKLPFKDHCFDFILAESVITFTAISKTLNELFRLLKRDGCMIIIEMTAEKPLSRKVRKKVHTLYGIHEVLSEKEWKLKLQQIGFTHVDMINPSSRLIQTDITDINPSKNLSDEWYDLWEKHHSFINQSTVPLGFRVFRCSFK
ncbi:class I SAM-dependent methyltransferase [Domibacillus mangrovi]|uniref:SAM-dependent methyltransferase n=1 Tax=Domibacillus mangrovi TaxID=1714354 RepID=A0A1Q5P6L1_9BACI|nr:class I SAM-dependent methyltransferase [Domibacillus mangrovi]OKL37781.1 SAM-dependent methyltransferase [Domibacillus mangrovi]